MGDAQHYNTFVHKQHKFTAYNATFEPSCKATSTNVKHAYHLNGHDLENSIMDMVMGIWLILKSQGQWLEEKLKTPTEEDNKPVTKVDLNKQTEEFKNVVLEGLEEKLKNALSSCKTTTEEDKEKFQEQLNKQTEEIKNIVNGASEKIEAQNDEILEKFSEYKEEIGRIISEEDLDKKFQHIEGVIRNSLDDVEYKLSQLKNLGRAILEEVIYSSGKTDIEKLVLENNAILKKLDDEKLATKSDIENIKIPGLEQLIKDELNELEKRIDPKTLVRKTDLKQESILEKVEETQKIIKDSNIGGLEKVIINQTTELKVILEKISIVIEKLPFGESVAKDLGKAKGHALKINDLLGSFGSN